MDEAAELKIFVKGKKPVEIGEDVDNMEQEEEKQI